MIYNKQKRDNARYSPEIILLKKLSQDEDYLVRAGVAANPYTPYKILNILAHDTNWAVRYQVACNKNTPNSILIQLSKDPQRVILQKVASKIPPIYLYALSKNKHRNVRLAVLENPNCPYNLLDKLSQDKDLYIQLAAVVHPKLPFSAFRRIAKGHSAILRTAIVKNENIPHEILKELTNDTVPSVRLTANKKMQTDPTTEGLSNNVTFLVNGEEIGKIDSLAIDGYVVNGEEIGKIDSLAIDGYDVMNKDVMSKDVMSKDVMSKDVVSKGKDVIAIDAVSKDVVSDVGTTTPILGRNDSGDYLASKVAGKTQMQTQQNTIHQTSIKNAIRKFENIVRDKLDPQADCITYADVEKLYKLEEDQNYEEIILFSNALKQKITEVSEKKPELTLLEKTKNDITNASYRIIAAQTLKTIKEPLVAALVNRSNTSKTLGDFFDSPTGEATLSMLLSLAIQQLPFDNYEAQIDKIAQEMRIASYTTLGNSLANIITNPLRESLSNAVTPDKSQPKELPMTKIKGFDKVTEYNFSLKTQQ